MSYTQTFMLYNGCMMKKQAYVLPNIITAFGLACGLFVIFKASVIDTTTPLHHLLFTSVILLLIAAVADMIDGALARILSAESEFGVMFDSLADAVSFGVAPSVVFLKSLSLEDNSSLTFFAFMAAMLYSICGVLRLVRFNVNASMIKGDDLAIEAFKKNFTGLPIPAAACCVVATNLFLHTYFKDLLTSFQMTLLLGLTYIFIGFLMVSKCKFMSLKTLRIKIDSYYLIFFSVTTTIFILYGIFYYFSLVLFTLSWIYVVISCLLTIARMIAPRRSSALKDFDLDEDE